MTTTLPFGKYKGRTIAEVLAGDPEYLWWLCSQHDFRNDRRGLYQDIIRHVEGLLDVPERKMMREWFQNVDFCHRFLQVSGHKALMLHELEVRHAAALRAITDRLADLKEITSKAKNYIDDPTCRVWAREHGIFLDPVDREQQIAGFERMIVALHDLHKKIPNRIKAPKPKVSCRFEQHEFDVVMRVAIRYPWEAELRKHYLGSHDDKSNCSTVAVKIKWAIGDNYAATVHWIRENRNVVLRRGGTIPIADHVVLLVGRHDGINTTKEQLVREMAEADIKVVFAADLEVPCGLP